LINYSERYVIILKNTPPLFTEARSWCSLMAKLR